MFMFVLLGTPGALTRRIFALGSVVRRVGPVWRGNRFACAGQRLRGFLFTRRLPWEDRMLYGRFALFAFISRTEVSRWG